LKINWFQFRRREICFIEPLSNLDKFCIFKYWIFFLFWKEKSAKFLKGDFWDHIEIILWYQKMMIIFLRIKLYVAMHDTMIYYFISEYADCLCDLGRFREAANIYARIFGCRQTTLQLPCERLRHFVKVKLSLYEN